MSTTTDTRRISPRLAALAPSATLAVDAKAKALKAAGEHVIGFGAGEPDFSTPAHIVEAAQRAAAEPVHHRYSPTSGHPALRDAICSMMQRTTGYAADPTQVLVTNGGKQAVFQTCAALVGEGDEVLLPAPYWTTYPEAITLAGGNPVSVFAGAEQGYKVTVDQLEAARTPRTVAALLCSPSNPTGAVYSPEELRHIAEWAIAHDLWIISDEIYQQLTYGDVTAASLPVVAPEAQDRCVILSGVAKTYAMTGWRVGWMVGPQEVIKAATTFQSHTTSNVCNIAQCAATAALTGPQDCVDEMRTAFNRRRESIVGLLNQIEGVHCPTPDGAFYAYPDVTSWVGRTLHGRTVTSSSDLAEIILEQAKVAVVPGEAFGPSGYMRLSYALGDDDLAEGLHRLQSLLGSA